jgi:hypothetical protein
MSLDAVGVGFRRHKQALYRFVLGRTNFNAVCVAEKLTTFTSTKPAARFLAAATNFAQKFTPHRASH